MKRNALALTALIAVMTIAQGCYLVPNRIEVGKTSIKEPPAKTEYQKDLERRAAQMLAASTDSPAADALATSLGPPQREHADTEEEVASKLTTATAKLNRKVQKYLQKMGEFVGLDIEGSGLFSFSWFTGVAGTIILVMILWSGLKIYGLANPAFGGIFGLTTRVSAKIIRKGFAEMVEGGQRFKALVREKVTDKDLQDQVMSLFRESQERAQSRDVQDLVKMVKPKK